LYVQFLGIFLTGNSVVFLLHFFFKHIVVKVVGLENILALTFLPFCDGLFDGSRVFCFISVVLYW
jgi:hypothetical protein